MQLVPNARATLRHAHSVHCWTIAVALELCGLIGDFWQFFDWLPLSREWFSGLGLAFGILGLIGRFRPQPKVSGDKS